MSPSSTDKIIVITGAARGIGLEWARQASGQSGTFVVAVVRSGTTPELDALAAEGRVAVVHADITKYDTLKGAAAKIATLTHGKVDVLINNAGGWQGAGANISGDISLSTPSEWIETYEQNTVGPVFFTQALIPLLAKSNIKHVVNLSSFLAYPEFHIATDGRFGYVSYSTAKAALNFATLKYHQQFKDQGYTFITLNPGFVQTGSTQTQNTKAPLTPEQSVSRMRSFVDRLTPAESGDNYSLDGSKEPLVQ
ncbi:hypothetical protein Q5752_001484 [Cryptotrichosporon argae]